MDGLNPQQKTVLELLESQANSTHEAAKTLDDKAQQNISLITIIVGIVGAFNIVRGSTSQSPSIFSDGEIGGILVIYAFAFALAVFARRPRIFATHPMKPTWEEAQTWLGLDVEPFYDKLIAAYTNIIEENNKILGSKALFIQWSTVFLAIDVITIFMVVAL